MKTLVLYVTLGVLVSGMASAIELKTLDMDHLMLLNVAVKGRIVNRMSDAISSTQSHRRMLVDTVKDCLIEVASSHAMCRKCVKDKCEKKAKDCKLDVQRVDTVMTKEEKTPVAGLDVIRLDPSIEKVVEEFTWEAADNAVKEVPYTMQNESREIVKEEKTKSKLERLRDTLQRGLEKTMATLPDMLPKVRQAVDKWNTGLIAPTDIDQVANSAAEQLSAGLPAERQGEFQRTWQQGRESLSQHLPGIINTVQNKMSKWMTNVGKAFHATTKHIVSMFNSKGNQNDNKIPNTVEMPNSNSRWASGSMVTLHIMRPDGQNTKWSSHKLDIGGPGISGKPTGTSNMSPWQSDIPSGMREEYTEESVPRIHIDPMPTEYDQRPFEELQQPGNIGHKPGMQPQPNGPFRDPNFVSNGGFQSMDLQNEQQARGPIQSNGEAQMASPRSQHDRGFLPPTEYNPDSLPTQSSPMQQRPVHQNSQSIGPVPTNGKPVSPNDRPAPPNSRQVPPNGRSASPNGRSAPPNSGPNGRLAPLNGRPSQSNGRLALPNGRSAPRSGIQNLAADESVPAFQGQQNARQNEASFRGQQSQASGLQQTLPSDRIQEFPSQMQGRKRRSIGPVTCKDIERNPEKACQIFHFHCSMCMNESLVLKQACGPDALKTLVEIKKLDLKTATYLVYYDRHMKNGLIVKKVQYDEGSFSQQHNTYSLAYITAKIGSRVIVYQTSALPAFGDMVASGGLIGDEIWQILDSQKEFAPDHFLRKDNDLFNNHNPAGFQGHKSSASSVLSAVNTVVWGVLGTILYMGFHAL